MGIQICNCNKDPGNIAVPYCDFSLENKNNKNEQLLKKKNDSICLPNGNNMKLYYENKDNKNNQNDIDQFDVSLSPISNARKNININIININNESNIRNNISSTNNNRSSLNNNNIQSDVKYDHNVIKPEKYNVKEGNNVKEEIHEQEDENDNDNENENEENESEKEDSKIEENKKELIEKFDKKIKDYAEYISDDKVNEVENSIVKKLEQTLDEISLEVNNNNIDCFTRPALLFKEDNSIYKGSWNSQGKKEGFGIFLDSKGNKYVGEWKDDKFNGKGRLFSIQGDFYEGYFVDGAMEGNGMFYSKTIGYKYIGEFKNNKFHGLGKIIYDNKMSYEGNFVEGYKEGKGKLIFSDGTYYEGNFEKNNFEGKGLFVFKDGRNYNGDWKNNAMDGKGVFNWGNECKYNGDYKNNKREGNGVYSYGCNLYDGSWLNNLPHGEGTLLHDGIKIVGHFRYGKILEMKEGKGVNREMTQKFTLESKACKSLDETTNKALEKSGENDSKTIKNEKYRSENGCKVDKKSKMNGSRNNISLYSKQRKNK